MQTRQPDNRLFPVLGAALYFCCIHLTGILTALYTRAAGGKTVFAGTHFFALLLAALLLTLVFRGRRAGKRRPGPAWLCWLPGLACAGYLAASFFFSPAYAMSGYSVQPVIALTGLLCPLGLCLFFRAVPPGRQGLALALCMIAGESAWIFLLPLLDIAAAVPLSPAQFVFMHKILGAILLGLGACLSAALWQTRDTGLRLPLQDYAATVPAERAPAGACLGWLTAGLLLYLCLMGLEIGVFMPRLTLQNSERGSLHLILLIALPLAGGLLDRAVAGNLAMFRRLAAAFVLLAAVIPLLAALQGWVWSNQLPEALSGQLFGLMTFLRSFAQLLLFLLLVRLAGRSSLFPLGAVFAYALFVFIVPGVWLARALATAPELRLAASFVLLLGLAACLWRGLARLRARPELLAPLRAVSSPEAAEEERRRREAGQAKLLAFSSAFNLTRRETEILSGIARGLPPESIQNELGISESTVRFHQTGLLKKTSLPSRQRLEVFYSAWNPA